MTIDYKQLLRFQRHSSYDTGDAGNMIDKTRTMVRLRYNIRSHSIIFAVYTMLYMLCILA